MTDLGKPLMREIDRRLIELQAELEAERRYRKGLEDTILKLTEAFDKAKNAKVICEDCGSALWRA